MIHRLTILKPVSSLVVTLLIFTNFSSISAYNQTVDNTIDNIITDEYEDLSSNSIKKKYRDDIGDRYKGYLNDRLIPRSPTLIDSEEWDIVVPDDFPTIQEAIDNAYPYARVYVRSGVYNEQVIVDVQALHIVGEDLHSTVILGKESETIVEIRSFLVTMTGFNISSGNIGLRFNGLSTTFNTISENTFFRNNIGIQIGDIVRSTLIYHNNFFQNNLHAIDQYENSMWFDSDIKQGNFWDDYTGIDSDGDGIGDTPYDIPGNHTKDYYPLISPYCGNCLPYQPSKPIGILKGYINNTYNYSSSALDPRELDLFYWFEWGDEKNSGWIGPIKSGLSCNASHSWIQRGNYEIRVRVKNTAGTLSIWSDPLVVTISKSKTFNLLNLYKLIIYHFPFLNKILNQ